MAAIQLAKLIGLKVIAVADAVRHGARLSDLGVDVLVDRQDPPRAVEIIRSVTKGGLRFGLDAVGKETATYLQESLQSTSDGRRAHLVGLTGLPKSRLPGVRYHSIPIKVFHTVPAIGEEAMNWLEAMLVDEVFHPPEVAVDDGGLEGINSALEKLRNGDISGRRLVVQVEARKSKNPRNNANTNGIDGTREAVKDFEYADRLNADPSRIKIA